MEIELTKNRNDSKRIFQIKEDNKKHSEDADTSTSVTCDLDLTSRSRKLMSLDVAYCIVTWFQV